MLFDLFDLTGSVARPFTFLHSIEYQFNYFFMPAVQIARFSGPIEMIAMDFLKWT